MRAPGGAAAAYGGGPLLPAQYQQMQYQQMQPAHEKPPSPCWTCCSRCCYCCCAVCLCCLVASVPLLLFCKFGYVPGGPLALGVLPYLDGRTTLNWWNLPHQRTEAQLKECSGSLTDVHDRFGLQYGYYPGRDAVSLMYKCTHVPGLIEQVPWQLRGVFWMKGNGMNEELATLQFGQWFPEPRTYDAPQAPFSWGWAKSAPKDAPGGGLMYQEWISNQAVSGLAGSHTSFTFTFEACPDAPDIPLPFVGVPGGKCPKGTGAAPQLTFARAESHQWGNITGGTNVYGEYTLEDEASAAQPASLWYRGIFSGIGRCKWCSFGSYQLVKLMDGDGKPVEPYYSKWLQYIGNVEIILWAGYTNPEVEALFKQDKIVEGATLMAAGSQ